MPNLSFPVRESLFTLALCAAAAACDGTTDVDPAGGGSGGTGAAGGGTSTGGTGGTGASICPSTAPAAGASCSPNGLSCTYGDELQPQCRDLLECTGGSWTAVPQGGCVPSSETDCLDALPTSGSECSPAPIGTYCEYAAEETLCRCTDMECAGACELIDPPEWRCFEPPGVNGCPATVPNEGTPCSSAGLECPYIGGACTTSGVLARCTGGVWEWADDVMCPA